MKSKKIIKLIAQIIISALTALVTALNSDVVSSLF